MNENEQKQDNDVLLTPPQQKPTMGCIFDNLESLALRHAEDASATVASVLTYIPVRKPTKETFFRIHPSAEYRLEALVLELREENETLLVSPTLHEALIGEKCVGRRILRLGVTRQGVVFVWPVRPPMADRADGWASTALDVIAQAETCWTRMVADMSLGGYRIFTSTVNDAPTWPTQSFGELLRIAFKNSVVDSLDHPTLRRLRGEV